MSKGVSARELRQRIEAFQTDAITSIVRQIDEANERIKTLEAEKGERDDRIGTLEAEVHRLQTELAAAQSERADLAAKVYHATRRGW